MSKQKPPMDPIASAHSMLDRLADHDGDGAGYHPSFEELRGMTQTVLMVRAIDRLTAAVNENTKAVRWLGPNFKAVEPTD